MPDSIAQQILDAVVSRLETITTGGGYNNSPSVTTTRAGIDAAGETLPNLAVRIDSEVPQRLGQDRLRFTAALVVEARTRSGILGLVADIQKAALSTDTTLGGLCHQMSMRGWDSLPREVGSDLEVVEFVIDIQYDANNGDPYTIL